MKYDATQLSPKDYAKINEMEYGTKDVLQENYVKRIAKYNSVDFAKLAQVYVTLFGSSWHEIPFKKLQRIAKTLPKLDVPSDIAKSYYEPRRISIRVQKDYRTRYYMLSDTYAYRRAVRVFGKTNIKKCYGDNRKGYANDLASALLGYRMVREVEGKAMANAMKTRIPTLGNIRSVYNSLTTMYYDKEPLELLPEEIRYDVLQLAKATAVKQCLRDYTRPSWLAMATRTVDTITRLSAHIRSYDSPAKGYYDSQDKLSKVLANMYIMSKLDDDLATVGLEIDKNVCNDSYVPRSCNNNKIDPKLIRAVKATLGTNYSDEEKRNMLMTIRNKLSSDYDVDKRRYWLPPITFKATKS